MNDNDEYREQLSVKLRALIRVLKVAIKKIESSKNNMDLSTPNRVRLDRIYVNLQKTLEIASRALRALGQRQTEQPPKVIPSGAREYVEMSSVEEYRKFQSMPPITAEEISEVNWLDLTRKFGGNDYNEI